MTDDEAFRHELYHGKGCTEALLRHHLCILSSNAPSFGICASRSLPSGRSADAAYALHDVVLRLRELPGDPSVMDHRVHDLLNRASTNEALGVLIAETVHPKSHFPGPLVCFRDMIVSIRKAAARIAAGDVQKFDAERPPERVVGYRVKTTDDFYVRLSPTGNVLFDANKPEPTNLTKALELMTRWHAAGYSPKLVRVVAPNRSNKAA